MTTRYDLVTSRKDREGKTRYTKIGSMFPAREGDGFSLKFDALPLPNDKGEVWVSAFVPREREEGRDGSSGGRDHERRSTPSSGPANGYPSGVNGYPQTPGGGSASRLDDDIPFQAEWR